jgi:UDP-glucuronate 4-epimerase
MNVLVTGGAGFIGSHLVEALLARGDGVTVLDCFDDFYAPAVKRANLAPVRDRVTLVEGDLNRPDDVAKALAKTPEVVFHLAARAGVRPSIEQPALYSHVNVTGTAALLEACRLRGVKRFVFGSSSSVYGARSQAPFSEEDRVDRPVSPYAATKVAGELLCAAYRSLYAMEIVALRFFTVYGPRQRPDLAIAKFARLLREGQPLPFFGDGRSARDYTFVADIVAGVLAAGDRAWPTFEAVNLGGSHPVTLTELVAALEKASGVKAQLDRKPDQPGDVPLTCADPRKARALLGWEPKISLEEGLRRYVAWARDQK